MHAMEYFCLKQHKNASKLFVVADFIFLTFTQSSGWSMANTDYGPYLKDSNKKTRNIYLYGDNGYHNLLKWLFV